MKLDDQGPGLDQPESGEAAGAHEPLCLTPTQAARQLNVSRSKLYQLMSERGGLRSILIGRSRRIRTADLRAWLERQPTY